MEQKQKNQNQNPQKNKNKRTQQWQQQQNFTQYQNPQSQSRYHDVKTYLSWQAPGRPFKERSKEYFMNAFLITIAIEIILFLFSQYLLMGVIFALVFLSFAMASIPPHSFNYKISTEGIQIENNFFLWEELYDFYIFNTHGKDTIYIGTKLFFPGELTITLGDVPVEKIKQLLLHFLPFREYVEPTFLEKAGRWLENNFPLEKSSR